MSYRGAWACRKRFDGLSQRSCLHLDKGLTCLSVGATLLTREDGLQLKDVQLGHFGQSKSISINKGWTTIVGGKADYDEIDKKIEGLDAIDNGIEASVTLYDTH